jgi:hypothetical protein
MSKFICNICNREFNKKHHLQDHISKKKKPCVTNTTLIKTDTMLPQINTDLPQINTDLPQINTDLIPNIVKINEINSNACLYCGLVFSRKDAIGRHIKKSCKVKNDLDNEKEKIFNLLLEKDEIINNIKKEKDEIINNTKKENEELKQLIKDQNNKINDQNNKINKILDKIGTKNINNGTINNIIITSDKLLKFGSEDLSKIDNKLFNNVLKTTGKDCFIECAKNIYNNPKVPQNQNIYLSDISRDKFLAFDGKNWKLENKIKVITDITDKIREYIDMNEDELKEQFKNKRIKESFTNKLKKYYDLYYEEDEIATKERIKQFQSLVDTNLINFLYDIRNDVKMNYNKLLEETQKEKMIENIL